MLAQPKIRPVLHEQLIVDVNSPAFSRVQCLMMGGDADSVAY